MNTRIRRAVLSTLLPIATAFVAEVAFAQTTAPRLQDQIVRVTAPSLFKGEVKGRVSAVVGDTLVVEQFQKGESSYLRLHFLRSPVAACRMVQGATRLQAHSSALLSVVVSHRRSRCQTISATIEPLQLLWGREAEQ